MKGLQAEYERVTAKPAEAGAGKGGGAGAAAGEVDEWKGKVDKLIREKGEQQAGLLGRARGGRRGIIPEGRPKWEAGGGGEAVGRSEGRVGELIPRGRVGKPAGLPAGPVWGMQPEGRVGKLEGRPEGQEWGMKPGG